MWRRIAVGMQALVFGVWVAFAWRNDCLTACAYGGIFFSVFLAAHSLFNQVASNVVVVELQLRPCGLHPLLRARFDHHVPQAVSEILHQVHVAELVREQRR